MKSQSRLTIVPFAVFLLAGSVAKADETSSDDDSLRFYESLPDKIIENLKDKLDDPETYNKYLIKSLLGQTEAGPYLQKANIKFLSLTSENEDHEASLGIGWDYSGSWNGESEESEQYEWNLNLKTKGNVAFDSDVNPADFLTISLGGSHTARFGGIIKPDQEIIDMSHRWFAEFASSENDSFRDSQLTQDFINLMRKKAGSELYMETGLDVGFESDQEFENTQFTIGLSTALDFKVWDNQLPAARANFFDYPSALFRWISGVDKEFTPNGASIPTILLGFDRVEPVDAEVTLRGNNDSGYFRAKAEITTKSLFAKVLGEYVFLEMNGRAFQEISAPSIVKSLGNEQQFLYTIAFTTTKGWYVSYSEGDLPFDQKNDRYFGVGFKYSLN